MFASPDCRKRWIVYDIPDHQLLLVCIQEFVERNGTLITTLEHEYSYADEEENFADDEESVEEFMAERFGGLMDITPIFVS